MKIKSSIFVIIIILFAFTLPVTSISINNNKIVNTDFSNISQSEISDCCDDFYFIQITDTHVMHKLLDRDEEYKTLFCNLINHINSFDNKPAFIVLTGDIVSFGCGILGALNYKAALECVYKKDGQLYADSEYTIPIYSIPGNHDYMFSWNLLNYHRFIDNQHVVWNNILDLLEKRQLNDRYTITYENLTLFFLDSGHNYYLNLLEALQFKGSGISYWFDIEWLETALNNCTTKHKIILMHHPAINWGEHDIIARNKENFIKLVEGYSIDLVLAGHTHASRVFEKDGTFYPNNVLPFNCSNYPPLYVQTDACKEGGYYRNITISGNDIWLNPCEQFI